MKNLSALGRYTLLCIACLTIMVGAVVAPGLISLSEALGVTDNSVLLMTLPALGAVILLLQPANSSTNLGLTLP